MSIIEKAAKRLEELRRSGIEVPVRPESTGPQAWPQATEAGTARRAGHQSDDPLSSAAVGRGGAGLSAVKAAAPVLPELPAKASRQVSIDLKQLAALGYLTPDTQRSQIADEFRVIKRPLLANVYGKTSPPLQRANLIMITSSLPGEGKTFVSVNLAISLAMELDKTVLLVDADVSRPSVLKRLGLPPSAGLLDILTDPSIQVADVLMRTNIDKLSILPSGKASGRATELLSSDAMDGLLNELTTRYSDRIVIFDAPPLLPSTESRVLATYMGQVVVVVEAGRTPQKSFEQALSTVESCPVVLPLLNKISRSEVGNYYGYYGPD